MKISWGLGILLVIIGFLAVSFGTIIFSFSQDVNLVTDNYYEKEVVYQQQINRIKKTNELPDQLSIKALESLVLLEFPHIFEPEEILGEILFYRPSDRYHDVKYKIKIDSSNQFIIPTGNLRKGMWRVKVDWMVNSESYYNEKIIMVK